ncbi:hypothetical protein ACA910_014063 [Epithemia clementina (nom. ined.)]
MSKNAGNRFVSIVWDRLLDQEGRDALELFYDRIDLTEDHVMFCRKANLYNETFNTESMVDVLWSLPILSSDLQRVIGNAMCMESTKLEYIHEFMQREPIIQRLAGGDISKIPLFRWRHIRDYTLRIDDGRFGFPCMCLAMDDDETMSRGSARSSSVSFFRRQLEDEWNAAQSKAKTKTKTESAASTAATTKTTPKTLQQEQLEYLIRSERVIAAGPLHLPTEFKDDPNGQEAIGDLILFNAKNRDDAVHFVEGLPCAQEGLYRDLRVHFYNTLDVTGKFVSEDPLSESPCADMKEAMEYWGYPVEDHQTPWLNW